MNEKIIVGILSFLPLLFLLMHLTFRKKYDLFEPLSFLIVFQILPIILSGVYIIISNNSSQLIGRMLIGTSFDYYIYAGLIYNICLFAFILGYTHKPFHLNLHKFKIFRYSHWKKTNIKGVILLIIIISITSTFLFFSMLGFKSESVFDLSKKRFFAISEGLYQFTGLGYLRWGMSLIYIAFFIILIYYYDCKNKNYSISKKWIFSIFSIGFIAIILPILTSNIGKILSTIIFLFLIRHYMWKRVKINTKNVIITFFIFYLIVFPLLRIRKANSFQSSSLISINSFLESVAERKTTNFFNLANILANVPDKWEFQYGKTHISWLLAPIPRILWPYKPAINVGEEIKFFIYDYSRGKPGGAVPPTIIGELYINFGILGLLISPLFWYFGGLVSKSTYKNFLPFFKTNKNIIFIYIIVINSLIPNIFISTTGLTMVNASKKLIPAILILYFITAKKRDSNVFVG